MKIKMIGTGSIGATAFSSSVLVNENILLDLGNGNVKHMKEFGVDPCKIKVVLISHLHGDHFADIPFFMFNKFFNNSEEKTVIYCPIGTLKRVGDLFDIVFPGDFEKVYANSNVEFKEFEKLENEEVLPSVFVNSFEVDHGNCKPAYGFTIQIQDKVLGFSGDSKLCTEIEEIVEKSNVSVLDASFIEKGEKAHMGLADMKEILQKYPEKKIIPTHMHDETKEETQKIINKNFVVLSDGESIEV